MSACVDDVECWMAANRLQLNHAKSEVLWCSSTRRQHQIPSHAVRIGSTGVQPVSAVRDLGIMLDAEVTMSTHVSKQVSRHCDGSVACGVHTTSCLTDLDSSMVVSKVDYCNTVLAGVSDTLLRRLQSVLNAAARLVLNPFGVDKLVSCDWMSATSVRVAPSGIRLLVKERRGMV